MCAGIFNCWYSTSRTIRVLKFFLYKVIFFFQFIFFVLLLEPFTMCRSSPSLNSFELHLSSYEFLRTSFVELRIPSNFIVEWRIPSIFIFRITNSFELHLLSYEFIRSSFFELRIHSNFIYRVTNSKFKK